MRVRLPAGTADVDIYMPQVAEPAPLLIVAHGFWRNRHNMSGWGSRLADEGFVAVVPDLPAWSDHLRNGLFISALRASLSGDETWSRRIDAERTGLMGFSAGGLATLLSAAESPAPAIWVGLDPVDHKGMGARAAPSLGCPAVVLTVEPSACNGKGNARDIIAALSHCRHLKVEGAVHVDAEWPTDWKAQAVCGRSNEERRARFCAHALAALREALVPPAATVP